MLDVISLNVVDDDAPLRPTVESRLERYFWYEYIPCWLRLRLHFRGSGVWYTGTARKGTGYLVCARCTSKKKFVLVRKNAPI